MNLDDFRVMLEFVSESGDKGSHRSPKTIIVQCRFTRDIPYLKRLFIQHLGEPDSSSELGFRYSTVRFRMQSCLRDTRGYAPEDVFYIRHADGADWLELARSSDMVLVNQSWQRAGRI
jgi:hypothetical protein